MTDMTQAPTPGPLTAESVKLLVKGDLLLTGTGNIVSFVREDAPGYIEVAHEKGFSGWHADECAFIGRPIDADGWIEHDGSDCNPLPGATVDARGSKFVLEPTARPSEEIRWDRVRMWRLSSSPLAPTAPVEASGSEPWTDQDIEDLIADSIGDSIDIDWSPRDGAKAVLEALRKEKLLVAAKPSEQPGLTPIEQKAQASRCSCRGADDMCPCQNAPDRQTVKGRSDA